MASLSRISEPPTFLSEEEHTNQQQSTPSSFAPLVPVLRLRLPGTSVYFSPAPSELPSCFSQLPSSTAASSGDEEDECSPVAWANGELFLTEQELSFLSPDTTTGFKLAYPAIALHAVTRSLPPFISPPADSTTLTPTNGCIYCQLDLSSADSDPDDDTLFVEMHIVTSDEASLDQLFNTLSHCASLHPSTMPEEDGAGSLFGHPFAGIAPFGTDASGQQLGDADDGAYEDADGDNDTFISDLQQPSHAEDAELSETGRRTMVHLESVMQWSDEDNLSHNRGFAVETAPIETNTLILSNLPDEFFIPEICSLLLSLLNTYGTMVRWIPLPSVERAIVVFMDSVGAKLAKEGLDRLILPYEDETTSGTLTKVERSTDDGDGTILHAVFGPFTEPNEELDSLTVPTTDKNFLISPPGSPPVGWEPIREDPPNRDTLADDLMRALAGLRDTGSHIESHQPKEWETGDMTTANNAPEVLLAPSTAPPLRVSRPAWLNGSKTAQHGTKHDKEDDITVPGVTIQSFDESDSEPNSTKTYNGYSISSVKATVESMRGTSESGLDSGLGTGEHCGKITPTSRPPLNDESFQQ